MLIIADVSKNIHSIGDDESNHEWSGKKVALSNSKLKPNQKRSFFFCKNQTKSKYKLNRNSPNVCLDYMCVKFGNSGLNKLELSSINQK